LIRKKHPSERRRRRQPSDEPGWCIFFKNKEEEMISYFDLIS